MRRIPWHVAIRLSRKGGLTAAGVALGVAFALTSLTVAEGLQAATSVIGANHGASVTVIVTADWAPLPADLLARFPDANVGHRFRALTTESEHVVLLGLRDGEERDDVAVPLSGGTTTLSLASPEVELPLVSLIGERPILRADYLVSEATLARWGAGPPNLMIVRALPSDETRSLRAAGLIVEDSPSLEKFFFLSGGEVARDLLLVVVFSAVLVTIFAYEFMASEIRESRREIGLWRAVGLRSVDVTMMLMARCGVTCALGLSGGAVITFLALASAAQVTHREILSRPPSSLVLAAVLVTSLLAALAGAWVPALRAARADVSASLDVAA